MPRTKAAHNNGSVDPLAVRAEDLKPYVEEFIEKFNALHPVHSADVSGFGHGGNPAGFGAVHYLISKMEGNMHLTYEGFKNSSYVGLLRRVRNGDTAVIGYGKADILCMAMGRPDIMQILDVIPNPGFSKEKWEAWAEENGWAKERV
jgi:hypothetical protein